MDGIYNSPENILIELEAIDGKSKVDIDKAFMAMNKLYPKGEDFKIVWNLFRIIFKYLLSN